jgi:hypothetical protein
MYTTLIEQAPRGEVVPLDEVADRLEREIDGLERMRRQVHPPLLPQEIQRELRFLRQLTAGLACSHPGTVWHDRAGFGSVLVARDDAGRERFYKLVSQRLDPLDAAQVSLSSELGRALLGKRVRDAVETTEGNVARRLRILTLRTLPERLKMPRRA